MGVVWLGRHELLARDVAVKFLLDIPRSAEDPNFAAFLQGARAAAALRHEGLNEVHHADVTGGVPYLVMEYIDGVSLSEVIKQRGPLPARAVRAILARVCSAAAALHDSEVIHRDIKPANIMLTRQGRVVVTDFGLACPRPAASFGAHAGALAGTPAYMAPEMFEGIVSARTDVYAIGCTAFQLLTGRLPYEGSAPDVREGHKSRPLDSGALQALGVTDGVIEAIERAVNKNVLFRPRSARQVLDMFEDAFRRAGVTGASDEELARLARGETLGEGGGHLGAGPTSQAGADFTYYDTLSSLAKTKRRSDTTPAPRPAIAPALSPALSQAMRPPGETPRADERAAAARSTGAAAIPIGDRPPPMHVGPAPETRPATGPGRGALDLGRPGVVRPVEASPPPADWLPLSGMSAGLIAATSAGVFMVLWSVLFTPLSQRVDLAAHEFCERAGLLVADHPAMLAGGRQFAGHLPAAVAWPLQTALAALLVAPCAALALWLYWTLAIEPPRKGDPARCGWCQAELKGLAEPSCPACGHEVGDEGPDAMGQLPPGRRWPALLDRFGRAAAGFTIAAALLALVGGRFIGLQPPVNPASPAWLAALLALGACSSAAMLAAYDRPARAGAALSGRTACSGCRRALRDLRTLACPHCETPL